MPTALQTLISPLEREKENEGEREREREREEEEERGRQGVGWREGKTAMETAGRRGGGDRVVRDEGMSVEKSWKDRGRKQAGGRQCVCK